MNEALLAAQAAADEARTLAAYMLLEDGLCDMVEGEGEYILGGTAEGDREFSVRVVAEVVLPVTWHEEYPRVVVSNWLGTRVYRQRKDGTFNVDGAARAVVALATDAVATKHKRDAESRRDAELVEAGRAKVAEVCRRIGLADGDWIQLAPHCGLFFDSAGLRISLAELTVEQAVRIAEVVLEVCDG